MDCEAARQWLDASRQDADPSGRDLPGDVREHLEQCTPCREAQHALAPLDRAISRQMRAVAIPDTLKSRLLEALATDAALAAEPPARGRAPSLTDAPNATESAQTSPQRRKPFGRIARPRFWLGGAVAAAVALVLVWWIERDRPWSAVEAQQLVLGVAFDGLDNPLTEHAPLPKELHRGALFAQSEKLLDGRRIAVLHYRVVLRGATDQCEVYVIPKAMISEPVPPYSRMVPATGDGKTIATWQENQHVFVFVCRGAGGEDLLRRLRPTAQLT